MVTTAEEISHLQAEFREELAKAGLSLVQFVEWYFEDDDALDNERAVKFAVTLKQQLYRRSSTQGMKAKLEGYLMKLREHPVYEKRVGLVVPRAVKYPEVDDNFRREMRRVSQKIDASDDMAE